MNSLALLWYSSLVLAALSLLVMLSMIIARVINGSNASLDEEVRSSLMNVLLSDSTDEEELESQLRPLMKHRRRLAQTILELATIIRGSDFEHAMDLLIRAGAVRPLLTLLNRGQRGDRIAAAEALGYLAQDEKAQEALQQILRGRYRTGTKVAAARGLVEMGRDPELADLFQAFDISDLDTPSEIETILRTMTARNPEPVHRRVWMRVDPPAIRAIMLNVLGSMDAYDSLPLMVRDMGDKDERVRAAAIDAIGQLGIPVDEHIIQAGLEDESLDVRAETVEAIGRIGIVSFVPSLQELLNDTNWDVRFRAANALVQLGGDAVQRLEQVARIDQEGRAGRTASLVLAEQRSRQTHA